MCYNVRQMSAPRVGIRELRQNLSVYLDRVREGETLGVTDRGRPVALLIPLPKPSTAVERLVASGRASAPAGDLSEIEPPRGRVSTRLSEALAAEREERLAR